MIETIALLRKAADECERRARQPDRAGAIKAEMMDLAAKCPRLAGEAAMLYRMSKNLMATMTRRAPNAWRGASVRPYSRFQKCRRSESDEGQGSG